MAEAWSRTRGRFELSERFLGMIVFKNINIFRENALSGRCIGISFKNNLIQDTSREARIASAPTALICPESTRGKAPWSFSRHYLSDLALPFFLTQSPQDAKNARNATRNDKNTQRTQNRIE